MIRGFTCKYDFDCEYDKCDKCVNHPMYQQGRADAIDECEKAIDKVFLYTDNKGIDRYADYCQVNRNSLMNYLEQLKENDK